MSDSATPARARAKTREGTVVSNKMTKSVVVTIERQVRDGVYGKQLRRTSRFMAHDEQSEAKVGDRVGATSRRPKIT